MPTPPNFGNRIHFEEDGCDPGKHELRPENKPTLKQLMDESAREFNLDESAWENEGGASSSDRYDC